MNDTTAVSGNEGDGASGPERPTAAELRTRGLATMAEVYGFEMHDGPGEFFGLTVEHLFGEIWNRPGLTNRDRRLLLIGVLVGSGQEDVLDIQIPAALTNEELDEDQLREIVVFLSYYAGWPRGARLNQQVEKILSRRARPD